LDGLIHGFWRQTAGHWARVGGYWRWVYRPVTPYCRASSSWPV
jgi:hypothetical protein